MTKVQLGTRAFRILGLLVERRGGIVTRQEMMDAVWPNVVVEENNLAVQLSNLRRTLDAGRDGGSCIQTMPGRGYRFLPPVADTDNPETVPGESAARGDDAARSKTALDAGRELAVPAASGEPPGTGPLFALLPRPRLRSLAWIAGLSACCVLLVTVITWVFADAASIVMPPAMPSVVAMPGAGPTTPTSQRPGLSMVVLPFNRLGDRLDDDTVNGIVDDLTTAIARWHGAQVVAHNTAATYKGKPVNVKRLGEELGVRFAVEGSVRRLGTALRVNVRLVSTETGAHLWAEQFDTERDGYTLDDVIRHIALALLFRVNDVESTRIARERSGSRDPADALTRGQAAVYGRPTNPQTQDEVIALLERAVELDPASAVGMAGLNEALLSSINLWSDDPTAPAKTRRAEEVMTRAEQLDPAERLVMGGRVFLLLVQGRCPEVAAAAQRASDAHRDLAGPALTLGICRMHNGRAADAIPAFEQSIRVNPRNPGVFLRYVCMGYALAFLERYDEAVSWFRKALAAHPGNGVQKRATLQAAIAAAQALSGDIDDALVTAADASRLWPTLTARSFYPYKVSNPASLAQIARMRDGLRLAGIRDHADEDADLGLALDDALHTNYEAPTPIEVPGARTVRTPELTALLRERKPLVLDASNPWGRSVPGAIALLEAGNGGTTTDTVQDRLREKMQRLTSGNKTLPLVAMSRNAERFQGRNLALRLTALGYTEVYWYRGGREAWAAAGLPEAEVAIQDL
jgi:TolB-like protein/DNA-binding winged helix-turn-helix (wHTH) protein/tetratricopeptide (TPR) repeat protein